MIRMTHAVLSALLLLAVASADQQPQGGKGLTKSDLDKLWSDLASGDAKIAFDAIKALVAAEGASVRYLKQHLKPRAEEKPERLHRLIRDLGSKADQTRQRASQELEKLGELAERPLRLVLFEGQPSNRLRSEIEDLLAKLAGRQLSAGELRTLRALEVLEAVGSQEAQKILQDLAKGAPAARETKEAQAALQRLQKRSGGAR
jgi:hypothetical protein